MTRQQAINARAAELLTVKEFASVAGLHPESLRRRIRRGDQRGAVRVGGQWRIDITQALDEPRPRAVNR